MTSLLKQYHGWTRNTCFTLWWSIWFNSLAPGKFEWNFRYVIFKWMLVIDGWGIRCEIALIWMSLDFTDDQSTLVQLMTWCRQATNHYLSQCWLRSLSLYGITRPEWVNTTIVSEYNYFLSDFIFSFILEKYIISNGLRSPLLYITATNSASIQEFMTQGLKYELHKSYF